MRAALPVTVLLVLAGPLFMAVPVRADFGPLDDTGCHQSSNLRDYHCHEGPLKGRVFRFKKEAIEALAAIREETKAVARDALAPDEPEVGREFGPFQAELVEVAAADRIVLDVAVWPGLTQRVTLRLTGLRAPRADAAEACERDAARDAGKFVEKWLKRWSALTVDTVRGDAEGRVWGRLARDGEDLGGALIEAGLARAGGDPGPLCR